MSSAFRRDARLEWEPRQTGIQFMVVEPGLIGGRTALPVSQWGRLKGQDALPGASMLLAWVDAGNDDWVVGDDAIVVPHDVIAELGPIETRRLGLPKASPFFVDISHSDTLDSAKFSFHVKWGELSGQEVIGLRRYGAIVTYGTQKYLLSNPVFGVIESIERFNADPPKTKDSRLAAWGKIRADLIGHVGAPIRVGAYLKSINVLGARAISVRARVTEDGFRFDPLLYGRCATRATSDDDGSPDGSHGRLLPEGMERRFAEEVFPRDGVRSRYVIDDGLFVTVDEIAQKSLDVVLKINQADAATRNSFALNPRPFFTALAEEYGVEIDDFVVDASMFSERVIGLGDWRRRTLGWLQKSGTTWLPDDEPHAIPLDDSGRSLIVVAEDVVPLCQKLQEAIDLGIQEVEWRGTMIPATPSVLAELAKVTGIVRPSGGAEPEPEQPPEKHRSRVGLVLKENEEELTFLLEARALVHTLAKTDGQPGIKTALKRHQAEGIQWLQDCYLKGCRGALLADDMGLGKTLVVLGFLSWLRRGIEASLKLQGRENSAARPQMPFLIVAPTSLLGNWEAEERLHLEDGLGRLVKAYGSHLKDLRLTKGKDVEIAAQALDHGRMANADWVLTTYETLSDYHLSFSTIPFVAVVFDETQKVKTPGIPITDAAKSVRSAFAIAMTGTPVENRLADLWTIMDVVWPGQLSASLKDFVNTYEKGGDAARFQDLYDLLTKPRGVFPPLMMRRLKEDELDGLPKRAEKIVRAVMSPAQASAFQQVVDTGRTGSGRDIMRVLQHMRGISLHPSPHDQSDEQIFIDKSARLKAALDILDQVHRRGEKALVFVESRQMQPYLASLLERRFKMPHRPMTINGSTLPAQRTKIVEKFQASEGFNVLLLGPKSAGTGLTLTAANHAIHLSRWWNPAVEDQCSDRIYRIGQDKPITVYYLLAIHPKYGEGSFDVKLHDLLFQKRSMSRRLLQPTALTPEELSDLWKSAAYGTGDASWVPPGGDEGQFSQFEEMDWFGFEEWVLSQLKTYGYHTSRTPRTGDGGADGMFLKFGQDGRSGLIQCKHTGAPNLIQDDTAVRDLIRARDRYDLENPRLVALTNAKAFSGLAQSVAALEGIELIARADLLEFQRRF